MENRSLAPETEHYLMLSDVSDKVVFALKLVEDEKSKRHLRGETEFLGEVESQLKEAEKDWSTELKRLGKPTNARSAGRFRLIEGLDGYNCQQAPLGA